MSSEPAHSNEIRFLTRASLGITIFGLMVIPLGWISLTNWIISTVVLAVLVAAARRKDAGRRGGTAG